MAIQQLKARSGTAGYRTKRRETYPPVGDQLDAIWKALESADGPLPEPAQRLLDQINATKSSFQKPAQGVVEIEK